MTATAIADADVADRAWSATEEHWQGAGWDVPPPVALRVLPKREDHGGLRTRAVGDLVLADWDGGPPAEDALPGTSVRGAGQDTVVIVAAAGGEEHSPFGGTDISWGPDASVIGSAGRAGQGLSAPHGLIKRTLTLPRAALVAAGCSADLPSRLMLEPDAPVVRLFGAFLDQVWSQIPGMNAPAIEATRVALVALAAGAIRSAGGSVADTSTMQALRAQLDEWITANLRNGPIRIEDLASAHNVSPRTIHRAFALTGDTMTSVVRVQRVTAAREDLVHTNLTIAAIANRWCYYDPSHLGRDFRRYFGVSPSAYRARHGC